MRGCRSDRKVAYSTTSAIVKLGQKSGISTFCKRTVREWFTGTVRIDPSFQAPDPALVQGASVTFEPGADSIAYVPTRSDADRDCGMRFGSERRDGKVVDWMEHVRDAQYTEVGDYERDPVENTSVGAGAEKGAGREIVETS